MDVRGIVAILFGQKIDYDILDDTIFEFNVGKATRCAITHPSIHFFNQLPLLVVIQALASALLAFPLYKLNVQPTKKKIVWSTAFTFLIALPSACYEPIYIIRLFEIHHIGLRMVLMTFPLVGGLRVLESYFGFTPDIPAKNFTNYLAYFSCPFIVKFDDDKQEPKRVSIEYFRQQFQIVGTYFIYTGLLMSLLWHYDWQLFELQSSVDSFDHSLSELMSWKNLLNNYFVALILSLGLKQSTAGVSLLYSLAFGYETQDVVLSPLTKSQSVSEFWGRQWNVAVHKGLKNGVYKPTRYMTNSNVMGIFAAFVISGVMHEYVNLVIFSRTGIEFKWNYILFFGYNACLLFAEHMFRSLEIVQGIVSKLPKPLITALVLCSALPFAHLFTGDWIVHGYFDAVMYAEPTILCRSL
mmetsp:Transcript_3160/g.5335  ORF Transcript_3160/g.5335 Transcript_3160/m.5335 type:complete len:411 (+) Transcript_3160:89-1321(+)